MAASSRVAVDATFSFASPFPAAKDRSFPLAHNTIPITTAAKNRFMRISLPAPAPVKKRPLQCAVRYKKFEEQLARRAFTEGRGREPTERKQADPPERHGHARRSRALSSTIKARSR